jgi:hypothetical protein
VGVLLRLIRLVRASFPKACIRVRLDGGFASPALFAFRDSEPGVEYVVAMASNAVLKRKAEEAIQVARPISGLADEAEHVYDEMQYAARSACADDGGVGADARDSPCSRSNRDGQCPGMDAVRTPAETGCKGGGLGAPGRAASTRVLSVSRYLPASGPRTASRQIEAVASIRQSNPHQDTHQDTRDVAIATPQKRSRGSAIALRLEMKRHPQRCRRQDYSSPPKTPTSMP